uniref:Ig-like domain-containing protein n=1 Tax=Leptobrachium leishanense TaxID=445787 RepID=A0A8C5MN83_9ANUR
MRGPLLLLLLLIVGVSEVFSGHSLQYYHTAVSVPGHGLPQFLSVGYVDEIEIVRYSSDVGRMVPVAPWMQKVEDPDYWERNTQRGKSSETVYRRRGKTFMDRLNQTGGIHIIQWMCGCELRDDGSTRGYYQYGYDGKDLMALDTERWVYYPLTDYAQATVQKWNIAGVRKGERDRIYLENICIDWLKKYVEYGKEELERRVRPEVKVSDQIVNGVAKLHCQVYGFYPRDVDVKWQKNGIEVSSYEAKHILPNSDGTYQIRVTVEVAAEDREGHSCHVEHASLDQTLTVKWGKSYSMVGRSILEPGIIQRNTDSRDVTCFRFCSITSQSEINILKIPVLLSHPTVERVAPSDASSHREQRKTGKTQVPVSLHSSSAAPAPMSTNLQQGPTGLHAVLWTRLVHRFFFRFDSIFRMFKLFDSARFDRFLFRFGSARLVFRVHFFFRNIDHF